MLREYDYISVNECILPTLDGLRKNVYWMCMSTRVVMLSVRVVMLLSTRG